MYTCTLAHECEPLLPPRHARPTIPYEQKKKKKRFRISEAFQNLGMAVSPTVTSDVPLIQYRIYYRSDDGVSESGDGGFPDSHQVFFYLLAL